MMIRYISNPSFGLAWWRQPVSPAQCVTARLFDPCLFSTCQVLHLQHSMPYLKIFSWICVHGWSILCIYGLLTYVGRYLSGRFLWKAVINLVMVWVFKEPWLRGWGFSDWVEDRVCFSYCIAIVWTCFCRLSPRLHPTWDLSLPYSIRCWALWNGLQTSWCPAWEEASHSALCVWRPSGNSPDSWLLCRAEFCVAQSCVRT